MAAPPQPLLGVSCDKSAVLSNAGEPSSDSKRTFSSGHKINSAFYHGDTPSSKDRKPRMRETLTPRVAPLPDQCDSHDERARTRPPL
jgi:hypothetical protein